MPSGTKPTKPPATSFPVVGELHRSGDWLWLPLRSEWRNVASKPEEVVRQGFIRHLAEHGGYALDVMDQERRTQHGHKSPRADIVVWQTPAAKAQAASPLLVVECKAEAVDITPNDYYQGESYARAAGCGFMVAHNARYTAVFSLTPGLPGGIVQVNDMPKAADWGDAKRIEAIRTRLRAFNRKEFQDLLFRCHSILRDVHKMDPGRAFDAISKILFVKMYIERSGQHGTFTTEFIERRAASSLPKDPPVHDGLFDQTKDHYKADDLFAETDSLGISESTFKRIVKELERFDLSKTSDDIKGLAFERFLGATFRGELGQYFTPRPVVDFMVGLLDPQEGELICDPASGSGGFLIHAFEHVRTAISADIQAAKDRARAEIEGKNLPPEEEDRQVEAAFQALNKELLPSGGDNKPINTRVGRLAWRCIFGCDAEPRAARTAKMNMIMHGDGHGGIHYRDGLVDVNGIFPGRFDVVITNPPFGSNVGADQRVDGSDETRVPTDPAYLQRCRERYGDAWDASHAKLRAAAGKPILELFEIGQGKPNRATEIVFVERCLQLLRPGGRLGIVLPDGNLNNPSLAWLRRWCEGKAKLLAVVSLPGETFNSADATVKASLVFLQRFTDADQAAWDAAWAEARAAHDPVFAAERDALCAAHAGRILSGGSASVADLLARHAAGAALSAPRWRLDDPPPYPAGIVTSRPVKPAWTGPAAARKAAAAEHQAALAQDGAAAVAAAELRTLQAALRAVDSRHAAALWSHVRQAFDYPVFVAAPAAVGITSTGGTGEGVPNGLPAIADAYRRFRAWAGNGANPADAPDFLLPSAA